MRAAERSRAIAVTAVAVVVTYLWAPRAVRDLLLLLTGLSTPCLVVLGIRRFRPRSEREWWAIVVAGGVWALTVLPPGLVERPLTRHLRVHDVITLVGYVVLVGGLLAAARRASRARLREAAVDAAILALGGMSVVWGFATGRGVAPGAEIGTLASPLLDCLAASAAVRLVLLDVSALSPMLLVLALVLMTTGDVIVALSPHVTGTGSQVPGAACLLGAFLATSAAALHPSMARYADGRRPVSPLLERAHLVALALAALVPPVMLLREGSSPRPLTAAPLLVVSVLVLALVVARLEVMVRLVDTQREQLEAMARTDHLTALPNRRTADAELRRTAAESTELGQSLVVAILDLDHFKEFNDEHGHQAGDQLLQRTTGAWRERLPSDVFLGRHGGEEFLLVAGGRSLDEVVDMLVRLRRETGPHPFSAGVAVWDGLETCETLVARADAALYDAKGAGRDRVHVAVQRPVVFEAVDA